MPPSTARVAPVTNELCPLVRNTIARATSSGSFMLTPPPRIRLAAQRTPLDG
jgi:hypothetical protein